VSYDILAFDPSAVTDPDLPEWWGQQSRWPEVHSYDRAEVTTPALRTFYADLIREFPPMNGPDAPSAEEIEQHPDLESRLTDYSIATTLIYAAFAWSKERMARDMFLRLAQSHGVAVAMISDDGRIIRPTLHRDGDGPDPRTRARWPWSKQ